MTFICQDKNENCSYNFSQGKDMVTSSIIKERLKAAIKQSGMTEGEIANQISVTQSCIAHYVKGDALPSLDTFANLCIVLDVKADYLLGITDKF